jgi:hypothetical protein
MLREDEPIVDYLEWYSLNKPKYESVIEDVTELIKRLLSINGKQYYEIKSRVKSSEGLLKKVYQGPKKPYLHPFQNN